MDPASPRLAPSSYADSFARDHLPPAGMWPALLHDALPACAGYPPILNCAQWLVDEPVQRGRGGHPALYYDDAVWTYEQLLERSSRVAAVLRENMGLVPGERVLLRGLNTPMLVACWLGVLRAGGICVTTIPMLQPAELEFVIEKARIRHALCEGEFLPALEKAADADAAEGGLRILSFSPLGDAATADLDRLAAAAEPLRAAHPSSRDDVALIAFTSGSTGRPKATVHFHRDVLAVCDAFPRQLDMVKPDDVFCGTPPFAFTFGLGALVLFPLRYGASARLFRGPLDADGLLGAIQAFRPTCLYTAPTMYRRLAARAGQYDLSSLRRCVSAGEVLPASVSDAFQDATGIRLVDGLGATEMLHIFVSERPEATRAGFIGRAVPGYEAQVVDEDGHPAAKDTPGLLRVRGVTGCRYLGDPERQTGYVRDGWNYTGDVCRMGEDGFIAYVARVDDMIVSSGYKISGPEVEEALLRHPLIAECAVVGTPDPERTMLVHAFVVLREGAQASPELVRELQEHAKKQISPYKYPRQVTFVRELPKTATGKLQRSALRAPRPQPGGR